MAELEESVGARSREIPAQYVGGSRRRLAVNDEDELWVGDGVLDIEVLAGIKGNDGFFVKGVRNPPRHVQVDGLDRVVGITRLVRPHADLVAMNEIVDIVPQVVPIDAVGIKPELESGSRVREEVSESDGKGMTDRCGRLVAGVSRLNGGQGYFPGTVNQDLRAIDDRLGGIRGRKVNGQAGGRVGLEREGEVAHRMINDGGEADALGNLDHGEVV